MDYEHLPDDLRIDSVTASERVNKAVLHTQELFDSK
jgi:hypothetical protein